VLGVPINAVTTREEEDSVSKSDEIKEYVFVVQDGKALLRVVKTGTQDNEYIEILSGLKNGEEVIIAPFSAVARVLKDKDKVQIVPKKELYDKKKEELQEE
jgi:HlyD family secretion protein